MMFEVLMTELIKRNSHITKIAKIFEKEIKSTLNRLSETTN